MNRLGLVAAIAGFTTVALGAFGAHALGEQLTLEAKGWWQTATLYALAHSVAALAIAWARERAPRAAGWAFIMGAVIFAGSLYAMALGAPRWFGAITPIGGVSFLIGWGLAAYAAIKR